MTLRKNKWDHLLPSWNNYHNTRWMDRKSFKRIRFSLLFTHRLKQVHCWSLNENRKRQIIIVQEDTTWSKWKFVNVPLHSLPKIIFLQTNKHSSSRQSGEGGTLSTPSHLITLSFIQSESQSHLMSACRFYLVFRDWNGELKAIGNLFH